MNNKEFRKLFFRESQKTEKINISLSALERIITEFFRQYYPGISHYDACYANSMRYDETYDFHVKSSEKFQYMATIDIIKNTGEWPLYSLKTILNFMAFNDIIPECILTISVD